MKMPILPVHGAFHPGQCWDKLIPHLTKHELDAKAVTLSGHGDSPKSPWLVSMRTYGIDVIAAAETFGMPCLALGHSMGGMAISQAAERRPDLFHGLVYLAAFVPRIGKSSTLGLQPASPAMSSAAKVSVLKGTAMVSPEGERQGFGIDQQALYRMSGRSSAAAHQTACDADAHVIRICTVARQRSFTISLQARGIGRSYRAASASSYEQSVSLCCVSGGFYLPWIGTLCFGYRIATTPAIDKK